jgi:hypothetical protein
MDPEPLGQPVCPDNHRLARLVDERDGAGPQHVLDEQSPLLAGDLPLETGTRRLDRVGRHLSRSVIAREYRPNLRPQEQRGRCDDGSS